MDDTKGDQVILKKSQLGGWESIYKTASIPPVTPDLTENEIKSVCLVLGAVCGILVTVGVKAACFAYRGVGPVTVWLTH